MIAAARIDMRLLCIIGCFALLGCAEEMESLDDSTKAETLPDQDIFEGKSQDQLDCSLESVSIKATTHTINVPANVCHSKGVSIKLDVGERTIAAVKHERLLGDHNSLGCTVWNGLIKVNYGLKARAFLYRIPVKSGQTARVSLNADYVVLDLLEKHKIGRSTYVYRYVEQDNDVIVSDAPQNSTFIHEEFGVNYMVVRARPSHICPNTNFAEYTIEVTKED